MPDPRHIVRAAVIVCLGCFLALPGYLGAAVREPVCAGTFYAGSEKALARQVERLLSRAAREHPDRRPSPVLRALIMPHAGYRYSGLTAAHGALAIPPDGFDRVLLLGPDHRIGFSGASLTTASAWRTPLGLVPIGGGTGLAQALPALFATVAASDRQEHSVEVVLPFLQTRLARFTLIPIVLGPCDQQRLARAIAPLLEERRTLLVVSADLSHYLPADRAADRDRETLARICALDPHWQADQENRTCGRHPVGVLLTLARERHWRPVVLHYSHSGSATGDNHAVVGYGAVAFYGDEPMQNQTDDTRSPLSDRQGDALVTLARQTLATHFDLPVAPDERQELTDRLNDPALETRCGTFVTLKIDGQLRGCIGSLSAAASIVDGVRDNAENAAFHDPRFPPLGREEFDRVQIEVSVLSEPAPLDYSGGDDLLAKLRPGIDGVIIRKGYASATFLPQVWEQLSQPDQFLSHLCMKAGLPANQWRQGDLEVLVYQVQYFEEPH